MELSVSSLIGQLNFWAVLSASLLAFFLGGLWYSPVLFESTWMHANGYSEDQVRQIQSSLGFTGFASAYLAYLALAMVFALLVNMLELVAIRHILLLAFLIWLGFVANTGLTVSLFSIRPLATWVIDAGFQLVCLTITGLVLGLWR